jgi:hypothetical protein
MRFKVGDYVTIDKTPDLIIFQIIKLNHIFSAEEIASSIYHRWNKPSCDYATKAVAKTNGTDIVLITDPQTYMFYECSATKTSANLIKKLDKMITFK